MSVHRRLTLNASAAIALAAALGLGVAAIGNGTLSASPTAAGRAGPILSIQELVNRSAALDGKRVRVRADMVVETHGNYIWARAGRLGGQAGACAQFELNDDIYNRRETLNRTHAVLYGTVVHLGSDQLDRDRCASVGLAKVTVLRHIPIKRSMQEDIPKREWTAVIDPASQEGPRLYALGEKLRQAVAVGVADAGARPAVAEFVAPDRRQIFLSRLAAPHSRPNAVLFEDANSFGAAARRRPGSLVAVRTHVMGTRNFTSICLCHLARCNWKRMENLDILDRQAGRAEVCLPLDDSKTWLDAGFLLGRPDEDRLGKAG